jgi:general secretion pathway protein C
MREPWKTISPVWMVHIAGAFSVAAGLSWWAYQWHTPAASALPTPAHAARAADPASDIVARWLGPGEVRLNIKVIGLARRHDRAVAVLAVNDAPPAAYLAGETLMRDVVLQSVEPDGITLRRAGTALRIAAPAYPAPNVTGIVRAR